MDTRLFASVLLAHRSEPRTVAPTRHGVRGCSKAFVFYVCRRCTWTSSGRRLDETGIASSASITLLRHTRTRSEFRLFAFGITVVNALSKVDETCPIVLLAYLAQAGSNARLSSILPRRVPL